MSVSPLLFMEIDGQDHVEYLYDQPVYQLYQFAGGKYTIMSGYPMAVFCPDGRCLLL